MRTESDSWRQERSWTLILHVLSVALRWRGGAVVRPREGVDGVMRAADAQEESVFPGKRATKREPGPKG